MNIPFTITTEEIEEEYQSVNFDNTDEKEISARINDACRLIWKRICSESTIPWEQLRINNKIDENHLAVLKDAAIEQFIYDYENDVNTGKLNGYDAVNRSITASRGELYQRALSPDAEDILIRNGFFYRGI